MRNFLYIKILLVSCIYLNNISAQWTKVDIPTSEHIYDIDFIDDRILVGSFKSMYFSDNYGSQWTKIGLPSNFNDPYHVNTVDLKGKNSMIASGFFLNGNTQLIYKSENSGSNWETVHQYSGGLAGKFIEEMEFPSSNIGYAIGKSRKVLKTTDGGLTWKAIWDEDDSFMDLSFNSINKGVIGGQRNFLLTSDGGSTFKKYDTQNDISSVLMPSPNEIMVCTEHYILKSNNFGTSWDTIQRGYYGFVDMINIGQDSILAGSWKGLFFSSSGGKHWEIVNDLKDIGINKLKKINDEFWVVGNYGNVYKSKNLGNLKPITGWYYTKESLNACEPVVFHFNNIGDPRWSYKWYRNDSLISTSYNLTQIITYALTDQKLSLITQSPGGSDTTTIDYTFGVRKKPIINMPLEYFTCDGNNLAIDGYNLDANKYLWTNSLGSLVSQNRIFSVSLNQSTDYTLVIRTEGGCMDTANIKINVDNVYNKDIWAKSYLPYEPLNIIDVDIVNQKLSFAIAPEQGKILKSIDNGEHWQTISSGIGKTKFASLEFVNDSIGHAAANGYYRTKDGGKTWQAIQWQAHGISHVKFRNVNEGLAVRHGDISSTSTAYITYDGGNVWTEINVSNGYTLNNCDFSKEGTWFCTGKGPTDGAIYMSKNNGLTWERLNLNSEPIQISVLSNDTIYAVLRSTQVARTFNGGLSWDYIPIRTANLYDIEMVNDKIGYVLGRNILFKTEDGGACWHVNRIFDGNQVSTTAIDFLNEDYGLICADYLFENESSIIRLTKGAYFEENKICIPSEVKLINYSDLYGYDSFQWWIGGENISNEKDLTIYIDSQGMKKITLVAIKNNVSDTIVREISFLAKPLKPVLNYTKDFICGGNIDTLIVNNNTLGSKYTWLNSNDPSIFDRVIKNDSIIIAWQAPIQSSEIKKVQMGVYGISPEGCLSDTLDINKPILQLPYINLIEGYSQFYCYDDKINFKEIKIKMEALPFDTVTWQHLYGGLNWETDSKGDSATIKIRLEGEVKEGAFLVTSKNACFTYEDDFTYEVVGPLRFTKQPKNMSFNSGETVWLEIDYIGWTNNTVYAKIYKDGIFLSEYPDKKIPFSGSISVLDTGVYFIEIDNGCFVTKSDTFTIDILSNVNDEFHNAFSIHPNLTTGHFDINLTNNEGRLKAIQIFDAVGKNITNVPINQSASGYTVDLSQYGDGMYLVKVTGTDGALMVKKIIKID